MKIELPWPDSALLPNNSSGHHWATKQAAKQQAISDATWATKKALFDDIGPRIDPELDAELSIYFYPPDNRGRDVDGMLSSMKPALDAIAKTIGINDRRFRPVHLYPLDKIDGGRVIVVLDQIPF